MKHCNLIRIMLILVLCLVLPFGVSAENVFSESEAEQAALNLSESELLIARGRNAKLTAVYDAAMGNKVKLTWESSDSTVATVAGGNVTGKGAGSAEITCHADYPDGTAADAVCRVSVFEPAVSFAVKPASLTVPAGKSVDALFEIKPENATYQTVFWSTADPEIAAVDENGRISGVNPGRVMITGELNEPGVQKQKSVKINVTVTRGVESVRIAPFLTVAKGKTEKLTAGVEPEDATDKKMNWTTSDPKVATVTNGAVRGVGTGTCEIMAEAADGSGVSASCQVVVVQEVTAIRSAVNRYVVFEGDSVKLSLSVLPEDATNKNVNYSSENPDIAAVDESGTVTGKGTGTGSILVTAADGSGKTARCSVLVEPNICVSAESFNLSGYFGYYNEYGIKFKNHTKTKTIDYLKYNLEYKYSGKTYKITGNWMNTYKVPANGTSPEAWWSMKANILTYASSFKIYLTYVHFTDGTTRSYGTDGVLIGWFN